MTDIEQAIARLETVSADAKEIDWIDQDDVAAIRTVLAVLRRLQAYQQRLQDEAVTNIQRSIAARASAKD